MTPVALGIQVPQFDFGTTLEKAMRLRALQQDQVAQQFKMAQAQRQQGALEAYAESARSGDPNAAQSLLQFPALHKDAMETQGMMDSQRTLRNARRAQRVLADPNAWHAELDEGYKAGDIPALMYQRLRSSAPDEKVLRSIIDQATKLPNRLEESQIEENLAKAAALRAKPADTFDLGPDHTRFRAVPDPSSPGGVRAVPIASGSPKTEKPPTGYEANPDRPGLRPIAGGPADVISQDQAARVALIMGGLNDMPGIREAFGVRLVPDPKAPNGARVEAVPGEFSASQSPLGKPYDPISYAQYYGGLGKVGEGQRRMTSAMEGVLRTLTGAAATKEEVQRELQKYMPFPTDTLETRAQKLALFERNLREIAAMTAKGTTATDILARLKAMESAPKQFTDRAPVAGGGTGQIPPAAVRFLQQNASDPSIVRQFEEMYGAGSAQQFLMRR